MNEMNENKKPLPEKRRKRKNSPNQIQRCWIAANISNTAGKGADYLVFENDLLTAEHEGFSCNKPREVYFCGKR